MTLRLTDVDDSRRALDLCNTTEDLLMAAWNIVWYKWVGWAIVLNTFARFKASLFKVT